MNPNSPYLEQQIKVLRAEQPNEDTVARTVHMVQIACPPARSHARVWLRAAAIALPATALAVAFLLKPQAASAADLMRIADAVRAQSTRHARTFTPSDFGDLQLTREAWIENRKHVTAMPDRYGGLALSGYDGHRMFIASSKGEGLIDDTEPSGLPIEDLGSYLAYPTALILHHRSGLREGGQSVEWAEDPSQPLVSTDGRKLGNGSKAVGRATFVIEDPIQADDPERLLWKPSGGDQAATATRG